MRKFSYRNSNIMGGNNYTYEKRNATAVINTIKGTCDYKGTVRISKNKLIVFIFVESCNDKFKN
jgi:hypothetical protein